MLLWLPNCPGTSDSQAYQCLQMQLLTDSSLLRPEYPSKSLASSSKSVSSVSLISEAEPAVDLRVKTGCICPFRSICTSCWCERKAIVGWRSAKNHNIQVLLVRKAMDIDFRLCIQELQSQQKSARETVHKKVEKFLKRSG